MDSIDAPTAESSVALDDARLRFFLERQEQIRMWAALAAEVQEAVEGVLRDLRPSVVADTRCDQIGALVAALVNGETATGPVLYRPTWCRESETIPDVGVALGWDGKVDPAGIWPRTNRPYVGVLCSHKTESGRLIQSRLEASVASRLDGEHPFRRGSHWVVYRLVAPNKDWWRDIPAWQLELRDELFGAWDRWADIIDAAAAP